MEFITLHAVQDDFFNQAINFVAEQLDISIDKAELEFLLKHQTREFSVLVENLISLRCTSCLFEKKDNHPSNQRDIKPLIKSNHTVLAC